MTSTTTTGPALDGLTRGPSRPLGPLGVIAAYRKDAGPGEDVRPFGYHVEFSYDVELETPGYGGHAARALADDLRAAADEIDRLGARLDAAADIWELDTGGEHIPAAP